MTDERDPTAPLVPEDDDAWPPPDAPDPEPDDDVEFWPALGETPPGTAPEIPAAEQRAAEPPDAEVPPPPDTQTTIIEPQSTMPIEVDVQHSDDTTAMPFTVARAREDTAAELEALRAAQQRAPEPESESHELPSIDELTFAPRIPDQPFEAPPAAPEAPRVFAPRTLSSRRAATLAAFADTMIPRGGTIEPSASDVGVASRLDALATSFDPAARKMLERFLTYFEWHSLFSRALKPFSKLDAAKRTAVVERAAHSKFAARRGAVDYLKFLTANQWASSPSVEEKIGFTYGCVTSDPPRDGDRLEVVGFPQIDRDHVEECDVVVVGSGAGGAVAAKEFAELGLSVVVVEEGSYFSRADFTGPPFERLLRMYRRQGTTIAYGQPAIPMPMGQAVGGTTVINSGTCFRTPDRVLSRWEREFNIPQIDPESMRPFFDRVEKIQRVQPVPEELLGNNARVFRRGVQQLGLHGAPLKRNIDGCRGCGVCAFGCPSDAKLAMHLTYLPRAQRNGATIYANARAEQIVIDNGRATGVTAQLLDPVTREPKATLKVRAKIVVLAAGTVYTPVLLAANAIGNNSGQLGRNLRIHPAAGVGAFFDEEINGWRGTLQPFYVDDWHESHDIMIEVTNSVPSVGAGTFPGVGVHLKEAIAQYPHLATAGLFVSDTSHGRVIPRQGRAPLITYKLNRADTRRMVRGMAHTAEIFLAAGARSVMTGLPGLGLVTKTDEITNIQEEAVKPGALKLTAFHPVGTARMGADPAASVVDPWGEVHGVRNLFVTDASVLPGCPTVNPQISIMAFATRTADRVARHGARYFG